MRRTRAGTILHPVCWPSQRPPRVIRAISTAAQRACVGRPGPCPTIRRTPERRWWREHRVTEGVMHGRWGRAATDERPMTRTHRAQRLMLLVRDALSPMSPGTRSRWLRQPERTDIGADVGLQLRRASPCRMFGCHSCAAMVIASRVGLIELFRRERHAQRTVVMASNDCSGQVTLSG